MTVTPCKPVDKARKEPSEFVAKGTLHIIRKRTSVQDGCNIAHSKHIPKGKT